MGKILGKYTLIIALNLFAFLSVGYILDLIFESGALYKIIFLILSIFSLVFISIFFFKSSLKTINDISPKTDLEESDDNINNK
ncbi:hypothetical protein LR004_02265 [Candidatus Gracilibacteria bacterium]|nr:hypothetical protein [Candidatus Gracilibacteria bacterium]